MSLMRSAALKLLQEASPEDIEALRRARDWLNSEIAWRESLIDGTRWEEPKERPVNRVALLEAEIRRLRNIINGF